MEAFNSSKNFIETGDEIFSPSKLNYDRLYEILRAKKQSEYNSSSTDSEVEAKLRTQKTVKRRKCRVKNNRLNKKYIRKKPAKHKGKNRDIQSEQLLWSLPLLGARGNLLLKDAPSDVSIDEDPAKCACKDCQALQLSEQTPISDDEFFYTNASDDSKTLEDSADEIFNANDHVGSSHSNMSIIGRYEALEGSDGMTPLIMRIEQALEDERKKTAFFSIADFFVDLIIVVSDFLRHWYDQFMKQSQTTSKVYPANYDSCKDKDGPVVESKIDPVKKEMFESDDICKGQDHDEELSGEESDWIDFNGNKC